jgi:hypothetical protein
MPLGNSSWRSRARRHRQGSSRTTTASLIRCSRRRTAYGHLGHLRHGDLNRRCPGGADGERGCRWGVRRRPPVPSMALSGIFKTEDATALGSCLEVQDVKASADNASVVVADLAMEDDKRERRLPLVVGATFAPQAVFIPPCHHLGVRSVYCILVFF